MSNIAMGYEEMLGATFDGGAEAGNTCDNVAGTLQAGLRTGFNIDDISHPAYMLSFNFELSWCNDQARSLIFGLESSLASAKSRNIFDVLGSSGNANHEALLRLAVTFWLRKVPGESLDRIRGMRPPTAVDVIAQLAGSALPGAGRAPVEISHAMQDADGKLEEQRVYGFYFREGILIVHVPANVIDPSLLDIIAGRESVVRNLMRRQVPVFTPVSILKAELDSFSQVREALQPEEYFQLIAETWARMTPIFRKYFATYGSHNGDGVRYHFLPRLDGDHAKNAEACALELECEMRNISAEWQKKSKLTRELKINVQIQHKREWLGPLQSEARLEFAARINQSCSRARFGNTATRAGKETALQSWNFELPGTRAAKRPSKKSPTMRSAEAGREMLYSPAADARIVTLDHCGKFPRLPMRLRARATPVNRVALQFA